MLTYISGQITGLKIEDAERNFIVAADHLRSNLGLTPINPMEILPYDPKYEWSDYMLADIKELFRCDAIYMLDNWEVSKGARIEHAIAKDNYVSKSQHMTTEQINTVFSILRNAEKQIKSETGLELKLSIRDLKGEVIGLRAKVEFLAKMMGYDLYDIQEGVRISPIVKARTMITGIIKEHLGRDYNQSELARLLNKDHASILNYERKFNDELCFTNEHTDLSRSFNNYLKINS